MSLQPVIQAAIESEQQQAAGQDSEEDAPIVTKAMIDKAVKERDHVYQTCANVKRGRRPRGLADNVSMEAEQTRLETLLKTMAANIAVMRSEFRSQEQSAATKRIEGNTNLLPGMKDNTDKIPELADTLNQTASDMKDVKAILQGHLTLPADSDIDAAVRGVRLQKALNTNTFQHLQKAAKSGSIATACEEIAQVESQREEQIEIGRKLKVAKIALGKFPRAIKMAKIQLQLAEMSKDKTATKERQASLTSLTAQQQAAKENLEAAQQKFDQSTCKNSQTVQRARKPTTAQEHRLAADLTDAKNDAALAKQGLADKKQIWDSCKHAVKKAGQAHKKNVSAKDVGEGLRTIAKEATDEEAAHKEYLEAVYDHETAQLKVDDYKERLKALQDGMDANTSSAAAPAEQEIGSEAVPASAADAAGDSSSTEEEVPLLPESDADGCLQGGTASDNVVAVTRPSKKRKKADADIPPGVNRNEVKGLVAARADKSQTQL